MKFKSTAKLRKYARIKQIVESVCSDLDIPTPKVGYGFHEQYIAYYSKRDKGIILVQRTVNVYLILHEVAHYIVDYLGEGDDDDPHGDAWTRICVRLYRRYVEGYNS